MLFIDAFLNALLDDLVGVVFVSITIVLLFGFAELIRRQFHIDTEWTRKLTHVGGGAVALSFPWLFTHTQSIALLSVSFVLLLTAGHYFGQLDSIHAVRRRTHGALLFPVAILLTWTLAQGDTLLYCTPLLILSIADAGASLVGKAHGQLTFPVLDGQKSVEGSLAFFGLSFGITVLCCAISRRSGWPDVLLVALITAALTSATEAISVRGSDNILIPFTAWFALNQTVNVGAEILEMWVWGLLGGGFLLGTVASIGPLSVAGGVLISITGTLAVAVGGPEWFFPLAALLCVKRASLNSAQSSELEHLFPAIGGALFIILLHALLPQSDLWSAYVISLCVTGGLSAHRPFSRPLRQGVQLTLPALPVLISSPDHFPSFIGWALLGGVIYHSLAPTKLKGKRVLSSSFAGLLYFLLH